jgi:DNA-binding response OmpR family regulator
MTKRILLVDDESAVLFAYKKVLQRNQVIVDTAGSMEETLGLLERNNYNAAILDLRLGGESCEEGFELISAIKNKHQQTTIIMITAYGNQEIKDRAYKLGANYYFEKPVSTNIIQTTLKESGFFIPDEQIPKVEWKIH